MVWEDHLVEINVVYFEGYLLEIGHWREYQDRVIWVIWLALINIVFSVLAKLEIHPIELNGVCISVIDLYSKALLIPWESISCKESSVILIMTLQSASQIIKFAFKQYLLKWK